MRVGNAEASKRVIGATPERAFLIEPHAAATPMPTGETIPNPVTTTRRRVMTAIRSGLGGTAGRALAWVGGSGKPHHRDPARPDVDATKSRRRQFGAAGSQLTS